MSIRHTVHLFTLLVATTLTPTATAQFDYPFNPYQDVTGSTEGGSNGDLFTFRIPQGKQIVAVKVRSGQSIDNLRIGYQNRSRSGAIQWSPWLGSGNGGSVTQFDIPNGDWLATMTVGVHSAGTFGSGDDWVKKLTLTTHQGVSMTLGGAPSWNYTLSTEGEVVGFHGVEGAYIRSLGIISRYPHCDASQALPYQPVLGGAPALQVPGFIAKSNYAGDDYIWRVSVNIRLGAGEGATTQYVTGLRVFWRRADDRTTASYETPWIGESGDDPTTGELQQFMIAPDDYLTRVQVSEREQANGIRMVTGIRLHTKGGQVQTLGQQFGQWWDLGTRPDGEVFTLFGQLNPTIVGIPSPWPDGLLKLGVNHRSFRGSVSSVESQCASGTTLSADFAPQVMGEPSWPWFLDLPWNLDIQGGDPSALRALMVGVPADVEIGGCHLLVDLNTVVMIPLADDEISLAVPADPGLIGAGSAAQVLEAEAGGPIFGVATASNALRYRAGLWHWAR